jgi:hypothetical protein
LQPLLRGVYRIFYVEADTLHVAGFIVSKGCSELLFFCMLRWDGARSRRAVSRAACGVRVVAGCFCFIRFVAL